MKIEHDSRSLFYRNPFGAVTCLSTIVLRLFVDTGEIPKAVKLSYSTNCQEKLINMTFIDHILGGSIFEATIKAPEEPCLIWYYFIVESNSDKLYYGNNTAISGGVGEVYRNSPLSFQITVYKNGFTTPSWFKNSVMYQIFPDRFYKGSMDSFTNGRKDIIRRGWDEKPFYKSEQFGGKYLANDFFGGNLQGILEKLPYFASLGIDVLYLNPIFEAFSNHKYDTGDYENIDPMFGNNALFQTLCTAAKQYNISIILDGVFNHTGSDSKYFNRENRYETLGAYQSKESKYYKWFQFKSFPDDYLCWWGIKTLPITNENEPDFIDYILTSENAVVKKWLLLGASGWRIDVADELPDNFIKLMRSQIKSINEQAVLIGEVWEDASNKVSYCTQKEYLFGEEFDSIMNYPLRNAIIDFVCQKVDAVKFDSILMSLKENYPEEAFYSMMNMLSSHDVARILTVLGDAPDRNAISQDKKADFSLDTQKLKLAKSRLRLAILLQMALPGVPCIYYGDEAGMQGYEDPFNRGTYPWGKEDTEILDFYKWAINLRKTVSQLVDGQLEPIYTFKNNYCFSRYKEQKLITIALNTSNDETTFTRLDLARFKPGRSTDIMTLEKINSFDGIITFDLPPLSFRIIETELEDEK